MKIDLDTKNWTTYKLEFINTPQADLSKEGGGRLYYSRFSGVPKNTMYVIKQGDDCFFGIARCNLRDDVCMKEEGRVLAHQRALKAKKRYEGEDMPAITIERDGSAGACRVAGIGIVKEFFYNLDRSDKTETAEQSWQAHKNNFFWHWLKQNKDQ